MINLPIVETKYYSITLKDGTKLKATSRVTIDYER
jgi:hypothetical protein